MKHDAKPEAIEAVRAAILELEDELESVSVHHRKGKEQWAACQEMEAELKRRPHTITSREQAEAGAAKYAHDLALLALWRPSAQAATITAGTGSPAYGRLPALSTHLLDLVGVVAERRVELSPDLVGDILNQCQRDRVNGAERLVQFAKVILSRKFPEFGYAGGFGHFTGPALGNALRLAVPVPEPA